MLKISKIKLINNSFALFEGLAWKFQLPFLGPKRFNLEKSNKQLSRPRWIKN